MQCDVQSVTQFKDSPRHGMMEHRASLSPSAAPQYKLSPLMKQVFNETFPPATAATRGRRVVVVAREVRGMRLTSALATVMLSCCCLLLVEVRVHLVDWSIRTNISKIFFRPPPTPPSSSLAQTAAVTLSRRRCRR